MGKSSSDFYHGVYIMSAALLSFDMDAFTWREVTPSYRQPPSGGLRGPSVPLGYKHLLRERHSIEYVGGRIILFGGRGMRI